MPAIAIPIGIGIKEGILALAAALLGTAVVTVGGPKVIDLIDDYLDEQEREQEQERVERLLDRVGEKSRAEQRRLSVCKECKWCLIIIQAQGVLVGNDGGSTLSKGPYVVEGRHVFTSEGIIVLGATHVLLTDTLGRRTLREIERLEAFARTAEYIRTRPPRGLQPGYMDYRANAKVAQNRMFRYDIGVQGTIPAFLT